MTHILGSRENPIKCDGPKGERTYLNRLIGPNKQFLVYSRGGSVGLGPHGNVLDNYKVMSLNKTFSHNLYFDMYWKGYKETEPPPNFSFLDEQAIDPSISNSSNIAFEKKRSLDRQYGSQTKVGFGYIWSKAKRLQLVGPTFYASRDYFSFPKKDFHLIEILNACRDITENIRGWHQEFPIYISNLETIKQLLQTFHYEIQQENFSEVEEVKTIKFSHIMTKEEIQMYFLIS
jgi:hypothetical protein